MKYAPAIFAAVAFLAWSSSMKAGDYLPGEYDQEALRLLRIMSGALPLQTTTLQKIAPEFAVEKRPGLTWSEALDEANTRFGKRQPQRAAFLRKYLEDQSTEAQLAELELPLPLSWGGVTTGSGTSRSLAFGPIEHPTALLQFWIAQGRLVGQPTIALEKATIAGLDYRYLNFDVNDRLTSATNELPQKPKGSKFLLQVQESTSGEGGVSYYSAYVEGPSGELELIEFTPGLVISIRSVQLPTHESYREAYQNGKLQKRTHYKERQVAKGTESFIDREEKFP